MKLFIIVNESPWGSSLASTALRFVAAAPGSGNQVSSVFFHDDGVYNALPGHLSDDGLDSPQTQWCKLASEQGFKMLLCSSAAARRLPADAKAVWSDQFTEAGLAQMWVMAGSSDRVVSF